MQNVPCVPPFAPLLNDDGPIHQGDELIAVIHVVFNGGRLTGAPPAFC